jgi:hypothetical protein
VTGSRYAIVDEAMQREAAARLDAFTSAPTTGKRTGTVSTFMPKAAKAQTSVASSRRDGTKSGEPRRINLQTGRLPLTSSRLWAFAMN